MPDREKVTLIGGPKDGLEQWVLPADRFLKIPVTTAKPEYIEESVQPYTKVHYDVAIYLRNLMIPEYFNFVKLESENNAKLGELG